MEVKVLNKNIDRALRKLKKGLDREGTIKIARSKEYYEKPSDKRYRKLRKARYINKLKSQQDV